MSGATDYPHRTDRTVVPRSHEFYRTFDIGDQAVLNATTGGNYHAVPDNMNYVQEEIYVSQRPYLTVLSLPSALEHLPAGRDIMGCLRSFMESRARTWGGITSRKSYEYQDITWGGGQTLSIPTGVTRQFGQLAVSGYDNRGEMVSRAFDVWGDYLIADPTMSGLPKIVTTNYPGDLLLDERSMSVNCWEPDIMWRDIRRAVLILAAMPREGVSYTMDFDVERLVGQVREISPEFTGLFEYNTYAAKAIARAAQGRMPMSNPAGRVPPSGFMQPTATLQDLSRDGNGVEAAMQEAAKKVVYPEYQA